MIYTKLKNINKYVSKSVNPMKTPDGMFEMYSVPIYDTGHPEYLVGREIGSSKISVQKGDILLCKINPRINRVWVVADESAYPNIASSEWIVVRSPEYNPSFLAWYFKSSRFKKLMVSKVTGIGGSLTRAQPKAVAEYPVPVLSLEKQNEIVRILDKVDYIISTRQQQLSALDELIKSRFVEMFGNPLSNFHKLTYTMPEVCEIIDGDRGKNYPKQEDFAESGYCLFLNAKNVTATGFQFDSCMFITKEKDSSLRNGKLMRGDIVLTTRGTLGNIAFYDNRIPYEHVRINSGMVILRMNHAIISDMFFIEQFKMQLAVIKQKIASGSAQPQLPINTMNQIRLIVPPLRQQNEFSAFVEQINKTKYAIQKSQTEMQLLFDSLMQTYFG